VYGASRRRTSRVPSFHGNDRLKFTAEEQQAIRAAEWAYGYRPQHHVARRPQPHIGVRPPGRPRRRHRSALVIIAIVVFWILRALAISIVQAVHSEEEARKNEAQVIEEVQPQSQSRAVSNSNTVISQNRRDSAEVPRDQAPSEPIPQRQYLGNEQGQPNQLPRPSGVLSPLPVDEGGRVIFMNE
jgi:cytoskeletal protein RodZ